MTVREYILKHGPSTRGELIAALSAKISPERAMASYRHHNKTGHSQRSTLTGMVESGRRSIISIAIFHGVRDGRFYKDEQGRYHVRIPPRCGQMATETGKPCRNYCTHGMTTCRSHHPAVARDAV